MAFKGHVVSEETRKKISMKLKGRIISEEQRKKLSIINKGNTHWLGKHHSEESKNKVSISKLGIARSEEVKQKLRISCKGNNVGKSNGNYTHGLYASLGKKKYNKLCHQKNHAIDKLHGDLSVVTIQMVYEDNIKKFGKLTCYLCEEAIEFGKDSLEHKIPISRGGTHIYENLGVAHLTCNISKHDKTEQEYRESLKNE